MKRKHNDFEKTHQNATITETETTTETTTEITTNTATTEASTPASSSASSSTNTEAEIEAPAYGSQEYWDNRYNRHNNRNHNNNNNKKEKIVVVQQGEGEGGDDEKEKEEEGEGVPGHEWYFTYKELKSLILPLILDGRGEEFEDWSDTEWDEEEVEEVEEEATEEEEEGENEEEGGKEEEADSTLYGRYDDNDAPPKGKTENEETSINIQKEVECNQYEQEHKQEENEEDMDEHDKEDYESFKKLALEKIISPKKILEIGCGDKPIGSDLCNQLLHFESVTETKANLVVDQIICFDYSANVIDLLLNKKQHKDEQGTCKEKNEKSLAVTYKVLDARELPYDQASFDLIMDKGTLDAMLSDKDEGNNNCIKIVSEASRLLKTGGYFLIVSHLNACNEAGLSWVNEILVNGLRKGDNESNWRIEVHSNDQEMSDEEEEDRDDHGPAVYIIRKVTASHSLNEKNGLDSILSRVDVKFFGY